jgi:ribokinase
MAGCVGDDDFGRRLLAALREEGVDHDGVRVTADAPTGLAMISVDPAGENIITVAPGANHEVGAAEIAAAANGPADVLVICAEIPVPAIKAALTKTVLTKTVLTKAGRCILNLAPAPPEPDAAAIVAAGVDWLVVNETEAGAVLGRPVRGLAEAAEAAAALLTAGARHAVVTAGAHGAALAGPDATDTVSAFRVDAVDTVGAGDTFVGALAVALAAGIPAAEAVRAASAAAATAATRPGAQAGMPRPADILATTGVSWPAG